MAGCAEGKLHWLGQFQLRNTGFTYPSSLKWIFYLFFSHTKCMCEQINECERIRLTGNYFRNLLTSPTHQTSSLSLRISILLNNAYNLKIIINCESMFFHVCLTYQAIWQRDFRIAGVDRILLKRLKINWNITKWASLYSYGTSKWVCVFSFR